MTEEVWQSNAQWDTKHYLGQHGDGVTTDTHRSQEAALAVCACLENEGFGCIGEHYPIQTWVIKVGEDNPILESIRATTGVKLREIQKMWDDVNAAIEETEKLQEDRIVPDKVLKERFDI